MPTYEYTCTGCGHDFEKFESMTAKPTKVCPECGKRKAKRNISSGAGFIFKGSGFYTTDYRSDSYKDAKKKDSTSKSDGAGSSDGKKGKDKAKSGEGAKSSEATKAAKPEKKATKKNSKKS